MGKLLTSLPMLPFLYVLKACINGRDCVHIHTLLAFAFPLPHCLAVACARNDVMVAVCICQSHLTAFMFVQAIVTLEGSQGKHIFSCLKGQSKSSSQKDPSFTRAILGITREQEVHSLSGQCGTSHYQTLNMAQRACDIVVVVLFNCEAGIFCYQMSGLNYFSPFISWASRWPTLLGMFWNAVHGSLSVVSKTDGVTLMFFSL